MSFWSKTKKSAARSKQAVAAKVGASEETVDASFNFEKERFQQYYAQVKEVERHSAKMIKAMREFTEAQSGLFESVSTIFPREAALYDASVDARSAAAEMDEARAILEQNIDNNILKPIIRYKMQFKEMKARMNSWEKKKLDLDRYRSDVKAHRKAGKELKEKAAQQKLDLATHNFDMLNSEIQQDLDKLYNDRIPFMEPVFATMTTCGLEFYIAATGAMSKSAGAAGRIDRNKALSHGFVITPREDSAAYTVSSKSFAPRDNLINLRKSAEPVQDATKQDATKMRSQSHSIALYDKDKANSIDFSPFDELPSPLVTKSKSKSNLPDLPMPPPPPFETLPAL